MMKNLKNLIGGELEKAAVNKIEGVSYDEMIKYILNNVEYTYNVSKCISEFIGSLWESGATEGVFFMTEEQEHFKITTHYRILNKDTDIEEIIYTYDVEKL